MRQPGQTGKLQYSCERLCCCSCTRIEPVPRPRVERHCSENRTGFTAKPCRLCAQQHRSRARVSMATYLTKHMFYLFLLLASQSGRTLILLSERFLTICQMEGSNDFHISIITVNNQIWSRTHYLIHHDHTMHHRAQIGNNFKNIFSTKIFAFALHCHGYRIYGWSTGILNKHEPVIPVFKLHKIMYALNHIITWKLLHEVC
jgi:hypothetical protein